MTAKDIVIFKNWLKNSSADDFDVRKEKGVGGEERGGGEGGGLTLLSFVDVDPKKQFCFDFV